MLEYLEDGKEKVIMVSDNDSPMGMGSTYAGYFKRVHSLNGETFIEFDIHKRGSEGEELSEFIPNMINLRYVTMISDRELHT